MDISPKQVLDLAAKYIGYKEKASDKIVSGATYTIINWGG